MSFALATYNILASAYIRRAWYPRTPSLVLEPTWRVPALVQHISKLDADLLCLQEVEPESFVALRTSLGEQGYGGQYARKQAGRPEGVAIFYRQRIFELLSVRALAYADGGGTPDTGYIALIARFQTANGVLGVVNTHLMWDPPNTPQGALINLRQARQLIVEYENCKSDARGWIIGGDFNATPASETVLLLEEARLKYAHRDFTNSFTCNMGGSARMIDYLFFSAALHADPSAPTQIDSQTILPSAEQPSDHIAIVSEFDWNG